MFYLPLLFKLNEIIRINCQFLIFKKTTFAE